MLHRATWILVILLSFGAGCAERGKLSIAGISPKVGPHHGGDPVTIAGTGFRLEQQGLTVYFGGKKATKIVIQSDTEIRVDPPAGEPGQEVDVEINFDDSRSAKLPKAYKYVDMNPKSAAAGG